VYAVLFGFSASNCIIFGEYTLFALGVGSTPSAQKGLAVGLITAVTVMHGCFRRTGIMVQNVLGWLKIGLVGFMIITSVVVVVFRGIAWTPPEAAAAATEERSLASAWDALWAGSVWNLEVMTTALFKVWYSYAGFDSVNNVLNEVKDPVRTLRSAAPAALMTACVLYLFVNIAYLLVIPLDEIKNSGELIAGLFFQRTFGAALGRIILPLVVALSAAGNVMVVTFSLVRGQREYGAFTNRLGTTKSGDSTPGIPPVR
jgi:amino acid transporter